MSAFREDPLTGRRVLIAEHRAERPNEFSGAAKPPADTDEGPHADCPFCPGNEHTSAPPTLMRLDGACLLVYHYY